ncbi:MAG: Gfo/Idh/MocA family oxidoreductase [Eubacterium sp.]|nr:Gfo/Idh/MocA family oxidoreductase [Eubacterium sp.]
MPQEKKLIRWGITGTGKIADIYANMIRSLPDMEVSGVAARDAAKTERFRSEHDIRKAYASLEEMIADGQIDCVFVGTPHSVHKEQVKQLMDAGIPVLCTKPMSLSLEEVEGLFQYAAEKGVMLWESAWHLFKPTMIQARKLLKEGAVGTVLKTEIHCSFIAEYDPKNRLFDKKLGGGSLLDVGIYGVSVCHFLMCRKPAAIKAAARIGSTGCDEIMEILLQYPDGALACLESGLVDEDRQEIRVVGSEGTLFIDDFWYADHLTIRRRDGSETVVATEDHTETWTSERHDYQLLQFAECVRDPSKRQEIWRAEDSAAVHEIMGEAFRQTGISYSPDQNTF